ncbi:hypothetical protein B0H11DRAFT_1978161 [Mycena galericulata]|nr:hypothetical protein B0H11DRAFT_1978161 [Mycena galericulata]
MSAATHDEILNTFRQELFDEGILQEGDTIGTDDETLLCVRKSGALAIRSSFADDFSGLVNST